MEIQIERNVLTVAAEHRTQAEMEGTKFYRREIAVGRASRSLRLPEGLDLEAVSANFEHGLLTIRLPKSESAKPSVIRVPLNKPEA